MVYIFIYIIYSTRKILSISTVSRSMHSVAQTRELVCTKIVLPQVIDRGMYICILNEKKRRIIKKHIFLCSYIGLDVREIAHDVQSQVSHYVTSELKLQNTFDTWHGKIL